MYYLYIITSEIAGKHYVGVTDNYLRRLTEHNTSDRNTFTSKYRPWKIAAVFECSNDMGTARKMENFIKKQKSKTLIERMINNEPLTGLLAQLVIP